MSATRRQNAVDKRAIAKSDGVPRPRAADKLTPLPSHALAECAESAQAYGVTVVPENHSSVCFTYQELLSLVKDVGHPRCRACPDVYNFSKHTGEDVVYEAARALVKDSPYSHLQFYEIDDTGRELHMDMKRLVKIYQDAGYRGYLMIEWEGKEDPYWAVSNAATYLRSILS